MLRSVPYDGNYDGKHQEKAFFSSVKRVFFAEHTVINSHGLMDLSGRAAPSLSQDRGMLLFHVGSGKGSASHFATHPPAHPGSAHPSALHRPTVIVPQELQKRDRLTPERPHFLPFEGGPAHRRTRTGSKETVHQCATASQALRGEQEGEVTQAGLDRERPAGVPATHSHTTGSNKFTEGAWRSGRGRTAERWHVSAAGSESQP